MRILLRLIICKPPGLCGRSADVSRRSSAFPNPLGNAAIAVLQPVIEIKRGDRAERLVIEAFLAQTFLEILFKIVERFQLFGERRLAFAGGGTEELLKAPVHQPTNFLAHANASPFRDVDGAVAIPKIHGAAASGHAHTAVAGRDNKTQAL